MTKDELARNLGTIARSGTSEFLKKADEGGAADGNLIGQFGKWCYVYRSYVANILSRPRFLQLVCESKVAPAHLDSFLVSPTVRVSSLPPATSNNPEPVQHTFVSTSSGDSFEIYQDPRGNTLGRGTEIILEIKEDEKEWLSVTRLKTLMYVKLQNRPNSAVEINIRPSPQHSPSSSSNDPPPRFPFLHRRAQNLTETRTSLMTILTM